LSLFCNWPILLAILITKIARLLVCGFSAHHLAPQGGVALGAGRSWVFPRGESLARSQSPRQGPTTSPSPRTGGPNADHFAAGCSFRLLSLVSPRTARFSDTPCHRGHPRHSTHSTPPQYLTSKGASNNLLNGPTAVDRKGKRYSLFDVREGGTRSALAPTSKLDCARAAVLLQRALQALRRWVVNPPCCCSG
jgi:hypothetical protein